MRKPEYGVRYVCERYPDVLLGWDSTVESKKGFYFFLKFRPNMKHYAGSVWISPEFFDEMFKEIEK